MQQIGIGVARESREELLYQRIFGIRGLLTKEGTDALDDFCNLVSAMAAWCG